MGIIVVVGNKLRARLTVPFLVYVSSIRVAKCSFVDLKCLFSSDLRSRQTLSANPQVRSQ